MVSGDILRLTRTLKETGVFTLLAAITLATVLLVPGCKKKSASIKGPIPEEVMELSIGYCGLYVWYRADEVITDRKERNRFFNICNNGRNIWGKNINEVYLYVDLLELDNNQVADFINSADGIDVYMLSSAGIWCSPVDEWEVDEDGKNIRRTLLEESQVWINRVKDYQQSYPNGKFKGLHLDFEYSYTYWDADPEHYARFVEYYCDFIDRCRSELPDITIGIDVTCSWPSWEIKDREYNMEKLAEKADYVNIMAYRDKAGNVQEEGSVEHFAQQWVELLKRVEKEFMISIETQEFDTTPDAEEFVPGQPEYLTVFEERENLNGLMTEIAVGYGRDCPELFRGEALHYYQSSIQTWQIIGRDYSSNPPEAQVKINGGIISEDDPVEVVKGERVQIAVPLVRSEDFSERKVKVRLETKKEDSEEVIQAEKVVDIGPGETIKEAVFPQTFESTGEYDLLVSVWDIDLNTFDNEDRITRKTRLYGWERDPAVVLDFCVLKGAIKVY